MNSEKTSTEDRAALQQARSTLLAQQETERLLTEMLDEKLPENWHDLASGALSGGES